MKHNKDNVKKFGDVPTPEFLVKEMLDFLPTTVWHDPTLKWLDPCTGAGIFVSHIVERLMQGLENFEPNSNLRYKHIMENMIYVYEIQEHRIEEYVTNFSKDNLKLNIIKESYLTHPSHNIYDIIVMNPPYNRANDVKSKTQPIWQLFVEKTIKELKEGGYLVAVHPSGWRNVDGIFKNVQNLLKNRQVETLVLNDSKQGKKVFGVDTTFDYYCMRNVENDGFITKIITVEDEE
jgi:methylase of polypeptide subunit release factors